MVRLEGGCPAGRRGRAHREHQVPRIGGVHHHGLDVRVLAARIEGVVAREHGVRVIAPAVLDRVLRRVREHDAPRAAGVLAAPENRVGRVEHACVARIEREGLHHASEVEHPPALARIARDVGARHVAPFDHEARVVGADGGTAHGPAAARTHDRPGVLTRRGPGPAPTKTRPRRAAIPSTAHAWNSSSRRRRHSARSRPIAGTPEGWATASVPRPGRRGRPRIRHRSRRARSLAAPAELIAGEVGHPVRGRRAADGRVRPAAPTSGCGGRRCARPRERWRARPPRPRSGRRRGARWRPRSARRPRTCGRPRGRARVARDSESAPRHSPRPARKRTASRP